MGYRRMKKRDLWEIYRRWQAKQSISHIAVGEQRDRKTIRQYSERFLELGLKPDAPVMDEQDFYRLVEGLLPAHADRPAPGSEQLTAWQGWRIPVPAASEARRFQVLVAAIVPKGARVRFRCHFVAG